MEVALSFKLKLKSIPIVLDKVEYTLKELNGTDKDIVTEVTNSRMEKGTDVITNPKGLRAMLVGMTLFDPDDKPVGAEVADKYPATVLSSLFEASQKLSGMTEDEDDIEATLIKAAKDFANNTENSKLEETREALTDAALAFSDDDDSKND